MRSRAYWPLDDAPELVGDAMFRGVNALFDEAESGWVSDAVNLQLKRGWYAVRPALMPVVWATGSYVPFPDKLREIEVVSFDAIASQQWLALCFESSPTLFANPNSGISIYEAAIPNGWPNLSQIISTHVGVVAIRPGRSPMVLDSLASRWRYPPRPELSDRETLPPARGGIWWQSRLWLIDDRTSPERIDTVWVGDIGVGPEAWQGSKIWQSFRVNSGARDRIVGLVPFLERNLLIIKDNSLFVVTNLWGTNEDIAANAKVQLVTSQWGGAGLRAAAQVLDQVWVLSSDMKHIMALVVSGEGMLIPHTEPVTLTVGHWMERVNWARVNEATMLVDGDRVYVNLPVDGSETNNALLVYNLLYRAWEGLWLLPVKRIVKMAGVDGPLCLCEQAGYTWVAKLLNTGEDRLVEGGQFVAKPIEWKFRSRRLRRAERDNGWARTVRWAAKSYGAKYQMKVTSRVGSVARSVAPKTTQWAGQWSKEPFDPENSTDEATLPGRRDYQVKVGGGSVPAMQIGQNGLPIERYQETEQVRILRLRGGDFRVEFEGESGLVELSQLALEISRAGMRETP